MERPDAPRCYYVMNSDRGNGMILERCWKQVCLLPIHSKHVGLKATPMVGVQDASKHGT
jgi:hypothetical protein